MRDDVYDDAARQPAGVLETLLRLLWPGRCAASGVLLAPDERGPLCEPLSATLSPAGLLVPPPPGLDAALALYDYDAALGAAIRRWKYARQQVIGRALAACVEVRLRVWLESAGASALGAPPVHVVPLPLHPSRLRERGFEQTRVLGVAVARALERVLGRGRAPLCTDALRRVRATAAQAGLAREARLANVLDAFHVERPLIGAVCLVDDVVTTGATAAAAASVLRASGASTVALVSVARAVAPAPTEKPCDDADRPRRSSPSR